MQQRRASSTRIYCVNCNISLITLRRYLALELETRVTSLLCNWVYPQIINEDDYVCEACMDLARAAVNQSLNNSDGDGQQAGTSQQGHRRVCILCGYSTLRRQSDRIIRENPTELQETMLTIIQNRITPRQVMSTDRLCHPCWQRTQRQAQRINRVDETRGLNEILPPELHSTPSVEEAEQQESVPIPQANQVPHLELPDYRRAANTSNHCIFPHCDATRLHGISDQLRAIVLSNYKYYLPKLARICGDHSISNSWDMLYESENSYNQFNAEQIQHIFSFVNNFNRTLDFENIEAMEDQVFEYWMGISKENFNTLLEEVPQIVQIHKGKLGLAALFIKMRTGDSDARISTLVQVPRRTLEAYMDSVRLVLLQDFVPNNLGINHITREELISRNLAIPNSLYGHGEKAITICDGTYIYINKSSNYMFQKQTYSLHKYRNLLKPFMMVACDGYIVDCFGPYKATTSDAEIMRSLFYENSPLRSYFRENDVFILDRGFRDSISLLEECGYQTCMPETLQEGEHQLTTEQANRSRCVTICRWVVEVVNGYLKRDFKIFRQEYFHKSLPHIMQNFQIAAALLNRFGVRIRDNVYANEIINIIRERLNYENNLANMIDAINMNRRTANFTSITADRDNMLYFPSLEYRELILFALGTYQIRQARSYFGEHVRFHGGYRIEVCSEALNSWQYNLRGSENTILIRGKIKSRHVSRKLYYVYILIENNVPGREGIVEYCCNCLVGRRTVGCCAHVMTLVWYLGWARYQTRLAAPAEFLDNILVRDDE